MALGGRSDLLMQLRLLVAQRRAQRRLPRALQNNLARDSWHICARTSQHPSQSLRVETVNTIL
eukprot:3850534-Pyramimonas_sp.AAC.1